MKMISVFGSSSRTRKIDSDSASPRLSSQVWLPSLKYKMSSTFHQNKNNAEIFEDSISWILFPRIESNCVSFSYAFEDILNSF